MGRVSESGEKLSAEHINYINHIKVGIQEIQQRITSLVVGLVPIPVWVMCVEIS